ncbi:hypothetical protein ACIGZJ_20730 [Kitasatospora sp. NPDC052868]
MDPSVVGAAGRNQARRNPGAPGLGSRAAVGRRAGRRGRAGVLTPGLC